MGTIEVIFWILAGIVFYTYIGYGLILWVLVRIKEIFYPPRKPEEGKVFPVVTLLIAAYNEQEFVEEKMKNSLELDYPREKLNIVWVTDGSNDRTNDILHGYPEVKLLYLKERKGKSAAVNRAMQHIDTPLIIFSDANAMLNREAVREIVKLFGDPKTGCVAGEKRVRSTGADPLSAKGENLYWRYESFLKEMDSRLYTAVGAAGELFSIRRELFTEIEEEVLLDDFVLSMSIFSKGYKIAYCKSAYATESGSLNLEEEKKRKVRISAGGIQAVIKLRKLLNIFRYPALSFQFISHRVLRWTITPVMLFLLLPLNIVLVLEGNIVLYNVLLAVQLLFYALGIAGCLMEKRGYVNKFLMIPCYFLFMNISVVKGFIFLAGRKGGDGTWEKAKRHNS